jgi:hypothetical protein
MPCLRNTGRHEPVCARSCCLDKGSAARDARGCCDCCQLWIVSGPNEALVKTGLCAGGVTDGGRAQVGGCMCVLPCCQLVDVLDLSAMQIKVETKNMLTTKGVEIDVTGLFILRVDPGTEWHPHVV